MATPFLGEIQMFGGNFAISGWALCDGRALQIAEYSALYTLIGTTYGGDGINTFNVPDLRGRIPVHQGNGFVMGQAAGEETHTLTTGELPSHTHSVAAQTNGNSSTPAGNVFAGGGPTVYKAGASSGSLSSRAVLSNNGSQPHDNMMPFLVVNFIIALNGIFPSRN